MNFWRHGLSEAPVQKYVEFLASVAEETLSLLWSKELLTSRGKLAAKVYTLTSLNVQLNTFTIHIPSMLFQLL